MLVLCLVTVYLVWGTTYLATKVGVMNLPPLLFGGVRFLIGGALLLGVALWRGLRPAQLAGQWWHLHVLSLLGVALCNGAQVWAMQWVPSHASALLNASSALWIVMFGLYGARAHRPAAAAVAGLVIGFAGTVLLMWPSRCAGPGHAAGATAGHPGRLHRVVPGDHIHAQPQPSSGHLRAGRHADAARRSVAGAGRPAGR
jgi:drug/metabolite transporter (DMT)-like permease